MNSYGLRFPKAIQDHIKDSTIGVSEVVVMLENLSDYGKCKEVCNIGYCDECKLNPFNPKRKEQIIKYYERYNRSN